MLPSNLRDRALELRAYIKGYNAAKDYGQPEYTTMTLAFLDDLLLIATNLIPIVNYVKPLGDLAVEPLAGHEDRAKPDLAMVSPPQHEHSETKPSESLRGGILEQPNPAIEEANEPYFAEVPVGRRMEVPLVKALSSEQPRRGRQAKLQLSDLPMVRERIDAGLGLDGLAREFGCSAQTVAKYLKVNGLKVARRREAIAKGARDDDMLADEHDKSLVISTPFRLDFAPLNPEDWPEIQALIATSRSREIIASDYDVPVDYLNSFIAEQLRGAQERRAAKAMSSGES